MWWNVLIFLVNKPGENGMFSKIHSYAPVSEPTFTFSNSTIETPEQCMDSVQSWQ